MPGFDNIHYSALSSTEIIRILGQRLRQYRLHRQLTQQELADRTGLAKPTISRIESGQSDDMSLKTFLMLVRHLANIEVIGDLLPELPENLYPRKPTPTRHRIRKPSSE